MSFAVPSRLARTRTTYLDAERSLEDASVLCPVRGCSISRDECLACAECGGGSAGRIRCMYPVDWQPDDDLTRPLEETPLWRMMQPRVACVRDSVGVRAAMILMSALDAAMLPVVDRDGRPIGVIAASDLVRPLSAAETVADRMSAMVLSLTETETVATAAKLMGCEGVSHIPVVSRSGRLVGQISARDILGWMVRQERMLSSDGRAARSSLRSGRLARGTGERPMP